MLLRSIFIALVSASLAFAQAADTRDLDAYSAAINTPGLARAAALQRYLATFQGGALHIDALEWLTWTQLQSRDATAAQPGAAALQAADTNNALASAVMLLAAARAAKPTSSPTVMDAARRALDAVPHMHRPEGMADAEFANMRRTVAGMLDGAAGLTAWRAHKFDDARVYLKYALSVFPRDPAYAYALGIADLDGKNSNSSEGYWYLARAVNLSHSSQVAEYASQRYFADGGTPVDWSRFVQATALDGAPVRTPAAGSASFVASQTADVRAAFAAQQNSRARPAPNWRPSGTARRTRRRARLARHPHRNLSYQETGSRRRLVYARRHAAPLGKKR